MTGAGAGDPRWVRSWGREAAGEAPKEQYLDAAVDLLNEEGTSRQAMGISMGAVAAAAGISRPAIYQHWPTAEELTGDLALYATTMRPGWQRRLIAEPIEQPLGTSIVSAVGDPRIALDVVARGVVSGWGATGSGTKQEVASWNDRWIETFAAWLRAHVQVRGRAFADDQASLDVATALQALIEGYLVDVRLRTAGRYPDWPGAANKGIGMACNLFLDQVTRSSAQDGGPVLWSPTAAAIPGPDRCPAWSPARVAILDATCRQLEGRLAGAGEGPPLPRFVDMRRLASIVGVSERRLFAIWPTASGFNQELLGHLTIPIKEMILRRFASALAEAVQGDRWTEPEYIEYLATFPVQTSRIGRSRHSMISQIAFDRAASENLAETLDSMADQRTIFLAGVSILGRRPAAAVDTDLAAYLMNYMSTGFIRLALDDPALLAREITVGGGSAPLVGYYIFQVILAATVEAGGS